MKTQYRAKAKRQKANDRLTLIDGIWYAIGSYIETECDCPCIVTQEAEQFEIEEDTLSININDMFDSRDRAIFASLKVGGKGGDIIKCISKYQRLENVMTAVYVNYKFLPFTIELNFENKTYKDYYSEFEKVGIQK